MIIFKQRLKKMLIGIFILILLLLIGFAFHLYRLIANAPKPTPQVVSTIVAKKASWQKKIHSTGTLIAANGIDMSSEVPGVIQDIHFHSGQPVIKGQTILQLVADNDIAQLQSLEASAELAELKLKRDQRQLIAQGISQAEIDTDRADLKSKTALVEQQRAILKKKTLLAPFDGTLGISHIDIGQYITPGQPLVTLQALDKMAIDFYVPQSELNEVSLGQTVEISYESLNTLHETTGIITAVNPILDVTTRNILVEAQLKNVNHEFLPGMFAHIDIAVGQPKEQIVIPQTAVTYNPYGSTVYIVNHNNENEQLTVKQVFITTGEARGDQIVVAQGISVGEEIVTSGQMKLKNGSSILINNSVVPLNDEQPIPQES